MNPTLSGSTADLSKLLGLQGAMSSVTLSHPNWHKCIVCRAAEGNIAALTSLYAEFCDRSEAV